MSLALSFGVAVTAVVVHTLVASLAVLYGDSWPWAAAVVVTAIVALTAMWNYSRFQATTR